MRNLMCAFVLAVAAGCGGDGDGGQNLPPEAQALLNYIAGETRVAASTLQNVSQSLILALLDPAAAAAAGINLEETATNTFDFEIPIDADGDGQQDAVAFGSAVLDQVPVVGPNLGLGGTINVTLGDDDGSVTTFAVAFEVTAQGVEVSGSITSTDATEGYISTITIPDTAPMIIGAPGGGAVANLCTASAQGDASVAITRQPATAGTASTLYFDAVVQFLFSSANARITGASIGDSPSTMESLPDSDLEVGCDFSISDWVGTFDMDWFCPPGGGGTETHTFTVTGPNTVQVSKLGTGQTTPTVFTATALPGNPHVLVGEFTEGDPLYTETFRYTLSPDGSFFTQDNDYVIIEGPFTGDGGPCYGTGYRQ